MFVGNDERGRPKQVSRTVAAIRAVGLTLRPTGRNRLHSSIDFADLDDGIARLMPCERRTVLNPYHEP